MDFEFVIDDADKITWDEWIGMQNRDVETAKNVASRFMVQGGKPVPEQKARRILGALPTSKMSVVVQQFAAGISGMAANPKSDNS